MADSDQIKELKKRLLDIEEEKELQKAEEDLLRRNMQSSGRREIGLIKVKYKALKDLVDEDGDTNSTQIVLSSVSPDNSKLETSKLEVRQPFIPEKYNKHGKYKKLISLQNLFIRFDEAPFPVIAKAIGLSKTLKGYQNKDRQIIINLQKRFNSKIKKHWNMILSSPRGIRRTKSDRLYLIRTSNS